MTLKDGFHVGGAKLKTTTLTGSDSAETLLLMVLDQDLMPPLDLPKVIFLNFL